MGVMYWVAYALISALTFVPSRILRLIFRFMDRKKDNKTVSKIVDPLLLLPAAVLADRIRRRQLRAGDVMSAYVSRAKEVNRLVNGVMGDKFDEALKSAQDLDASLDALSEEDIDQQYSKEAKPLLGVPVSIKGTMQWGGMSCSVGLVSRKDLASSTDGPVVKQLKQAGAIPFIQTNVPELSMWIETSNNIYGRTNNPYNLARSAGGSSGGEASMVAAGASVLGVGSDIGGSIRLPCAFNGVFGHKPSNYIVTHVGHYPTLDEKTLEVFTIGPLSRYAVDLIPTLKVLAKPGQLAMLQLDKQVEVKNIRIISIPDDGGSLLSSPVSAELKSLQRQVAEVLKKQGADVSERRLETFRESFFLWFAKVTVDSKYIPWYSELMSGPAGGSVDVVKELFLKILGQSDHTVASIVFGLMNTYIPQLFESKLDKDVETLDTLREVLIEMLGANGVLIYPTYPKVAPYHHESFIESPNACYSAVFNVLGFPVTSCPLGLSKNGLPMGLQLVTTPYNDHLTLTLASVLEKEFGGWVSPGQ